MLCYKDKIWCQFKTCKKFGKECKDSLTDEVKQKAEEWWKTFQSTDQVPISIYSSKPDCYTEK